MASQPATMTATTIAPWSDKTCWVLRLIRKRISVAMKKAKFRPNYMNRVDAENWQHLHGEINATLREIRAEIFNKCPRDIKVGDFIEKQAFYQAMLAAFAAGDELIVAKIRYSGEQ